MGDPDEVPVSISVVATTGPTGSVQFAGGRLGVLIGKVVDLCVVDNAAIVVTQITQSSVEGVPIGSFLPWVFQDNGKTGDRFGAFAGDGAGWGASDVFTPCSLFDLDHILANADLLTLTLTHGNINITP